MNRLQKLCVAFVIANAAIQVTNCVRTGIKMKKVFNKKRSEVIILKKSRYEVC